MNFRKALLIAILLSPISGFAQPATAPKPKLVVAIVIDQFRHDYLTRFREDYHGGLDYLLKNGANFSSAYYAQAPTVTAVGHSLFLTGAMPAVSGIVGNTWFDRDENQVVTSVCDWDFKTVGGTQEKQDTKCKDSDPASPNRLLVTTLGDELRNAHEDSKVVGVSIKARGAILPSGHRALGAFWFDDKSGNFVTSSFYLEALPAWADSFNAQKLGDKYIGQAWPGFPTHSFQPAPNGDRYAKLPAGPWGNELIEQFAEEAVKGEKLGQRGVTDLLTVSFSSNDYVGHANGPDSPEVHDMAIRVDQQIGKLFKLLDQTVGMKNVLVVLTADHGVASTPAVNKARKIPGGYLLADMQDAARSALNKKLGKGDWLIPEAGEAAFYLTSEGLAKADQISEILNEALPSIPQLHVTRVYSRKQLMNGIGGDFIAQAISNGFYTRRSGDIFLVFEPNYMPGTGGTTHFSPYGYDRHVPMLFAGPGLKAAEYRGTVIVNDIAPTLANMLEIEAPSGSSGRVLTEMLK